MPINIKIKEIGLFVLSIINSSTFVLVFLANLKIPFSETNTNIFATIKKEGC